MQGGTNTWHIFIATRDTQLVDEITTALNDLNTLQGTALRVIVIRSEPDLSNTIYRPVPDLIFVDQNFTRRLPNFLRKVRRQEANTQIILITPSPSDAIGMLKYKVTALLKREDVAAQCHDMVLRTLQLQVYLDQDVADTIVHHFTAEYQQFLPIEKELFTEIIHGDDYTVISQRHAYQPLDIEKRLYNAISRLWEPFHR